MAQVVIATDSGLLRMDGAGRVIARELDGRRVSALAPASGGRLWAAVDGHELWLRDGEGWRGVAALPRLALTCLADVRANHEDGVLCGTSQARLLRLTPERALEPVASFDAVAGRDEWFTPWGGPPDTRSLSEDRERVYVNVHVGGILRSRDEGATWEPTIDLRADVHQVATGHGRVYAAGAHGLSVSADGGDTWTLHSEGLDTRYCRAVAVCGGTVMVTSSRGPGGGRSALYCCYPEGTVHSRCRHGLPEWFEHNLDTYCLDALPDGTLAAFGTEEGALYVTDDEGSTWHESATGLGRINSVRLLA